MAQWECSGKSEALRLLYTAGQISRRFYQTYNFFVLPQLTGAADYAAAVFPCLNYRSIGKFWRRVKTIKTDRLPPEASPDLLGQTLKLYQQAGLALPEYGKIKKLWAGAETAILAGINRLIPPPPGGLVKSITVWPTRFGTTCSFNRPEKFPADICIYLRADCGIWQMAEAVLSALVRQTLQTRLGASWEETELVADWLAQESFLKNILAKYGGRYYPTLKLIRNRQNGRTFSQSQAYLEKLGLLAKSGAVENPPGLTEKENGILNCLKRQRGQTVSFEALGEIVCPENYSLFCIAKTIERLRRKLEAAGIAGTTIQTVRGKGYLLG